MVISRLSRFCTAMLGVMVFGCVVADDLRATTIVVPPQQLFKFVGFCADCQGTGIGYLVLQNYNLGDVLQNSNFVDFSYSSSLVSFDMTSVTSLTGAFPANLDFAPQHPAITIVGTTSTGLGEQLQSNLSASWCVGPSCNQDFGVASGWQLISPEPDSIWLVAPAVSAVLYFRRRRPHMNPARPE